MAKRSSIFIKIWCWRVTFQSKADSTCKSQDDEDVETTGDKSCKCGKFVINRTTFMRITSLPLVQRHCCAESLAVLFENAYLISNGLVHSNELLMIPIFILSASPVLQRPSKRKAVEVCEMTVSFFVTRQNLGRVNAYTVFCPILTSSTSPLAR